MSTTNALTLQRLAREYGNRWLVFPAPDGNGYTATRIPVGPQSDRVTERTLSQLRDRLDVLLP